MIIKSWIRKMITVLLAVIMFVSMPVLLSSCAPANTCEACLSSCDRDGIPRSQCNCAGSCPGQTVR